MRMCQRHWDIARVRCPNPLLLNVLLMQAMMDDEAFITRAKALHTRPDGSADAAALNTVAESIGAPCCYLGDERMEALYLKAAGEQGHDGE